ncbi:MAG: hypothetical protein A2X49_03420 [Lentisphaerae bacterium GWF2_52_8]|nr:MAG: hypothetical protein A2X49_03420 [Lentisphaerae bacterium GWF2_52_8]
MADMELMASIDIGAHSVRLLIAQVDTADGSYEILEDMEQPIPLGANVFNRGRISSQSILLMCEIFRNFRMKLDEYGVARYKAIATSAVREAANADIFIERLANASGLRVDIFEGVDNARLDYLTAVNSLPSKFGFYKRRTLLASLGTGACQLSFYDKGMIALTQTIRTGTLRILEQISETVSIPIPQLISPLVVRAFSELEHISDDLEADGLVMMGSSARALATISGKHKEETKALVLSRQEFHTLHAKLLRLSPPEIMRSYGISADLAEALIPCGVIARHLLNLTGVKNIAIPLTTTKDALLQDFIHDTLKKDDYFEPQILSLVARLAEKYHCNDEFSERTVLFAEKLFRKLEEIHGLSKKELLLLKIAAQLHKAGLFINNKSHHKHTYYLISSSEIAGLSGRQLLLAALVARYHRRSFPKTSHIEYMALLPAERSVVNKLASLLRLACGLAAACSPEARLGISISEDAVLLKPEYGTEALMDNNFIENDAAFFHYVFAKKIAFN